MPKSKFKEALEDMVWQFACRTFTGSHRALTTRGLSALEFAFDCLGWDDPHLVDGCGCEINACIRWASCVGAYPRSLALPQLKENPMVGFGFLCGDHWRQWNGNNAETADDLGRINIPESTP